MSTSHLKYRGFTLIELMISIILLAILTTLAVPSMSDMIARQRLKTATQDIANALVFAKQEAIRQVAPVYVVPGNIRDNGTLNGSRANWNKANGQAVLVFKDADGAGVAINRSYDANEDLRVVRINPKISVNIQRRAVGTLNVACAAPSCENIQTAGFIFTSNGQTRIKDNHNAVGTGVAGPIGRIVVMDSRQITKRNSRPGEFCRVIKVESLGNAKVCSDRETREAAANAGDFCYCDN